MFGMRRRQFITLLGGVAAAWPLAARPQQTERIRRIGALMLISEADPRSEGYIASFRQRLQELGWVDGRNTAIDIRWGAGDSNSFHRHAAELAALAPDVVLASGGPSVVALKEISPTMPIVFVAVTDPVGAGIVASLARPRGNITGFTLFEYGIAAKWLELLKEIAPGVTRVAVLRDPTNTGTCGEADREIRNDFVPASKIDIFVLGRLLDFEHFLSVGNEGFSPPQGGRDI